MKKLLIGLFFLPSMLWSQTDAIVNDYIKISGTVLDKSTNERLPYVNFSTETNLGTISNIDGRIVFKYPKELINSSLYLSSIGYKTSIVTLPGVDTENMTFTLTTDTFSLSEITVIPLKGKEIIAMAIENIPNNYHASTIFMDVFYRKTTNNLISLELRNKELYFKDLPVNLLKEAALTIKKPPVVNLRDQEDRYRVNAFRHHSEKNGFTDSIMNFFQKVKRTDLDSLENIKADSSLKAMITNLKNPNISKDELSWTIKKYDLIGNRKKHAVLSKKNIKNFIFELRDIVRYNDRQTYIIDVWPKKSCKKCNDNGQIYIDVDSYAFVYERYITPPECEKCFKGVSILGMTRTLSSWESTITYKKYNAFWGLSHFSEEVTFRFKMGSLIFGPLYLALKLQGQMPKEIRGFFPRAMYLKAHHTTEFFVNDIYTDDDIGFDGDNTMEETVVEEINADNEDIWGKFNYLEHSIGNKNKEQETENQD